MAGGDRASAFNCAQSKPGQRNGSAIRYHRRMPQRQYVHVIGFQVPSPDTFEHEHVTVLLDRIPGHEWRAVFQLCVEELPAALLRQPPRIVDVEIHIHLAQSPQRRLSTDVRQFIDRVNRMTFLREGSSSHPDR